uniref:EF-hand domain-containing protein n=1 Tax=Noctiluca scintillans TaxID=2966 RepID=A0A7S1AEN2_NOCSC|mmetsp:Transcript_43276/g.113870  ORF Transcript_43276/g.113870 Transcript_43276/m.113870 type:complete len:330 (+) Transcript_43276:79-1068(+)
MSSFAPHLAAHSDEKPHPYSSIHVEGHDHNGGFLNCEADSGAGGPGGSMSSHLEQPVKSGCFCCCRKANRGAHDFVDLCEYGVIEPVGVCCCKVVGSVVGGVCLVCAGACKCVVGTARCLNESFVKPMERGVGSSLVCVGAAVAHLGEPNEETKAAWKAAEVARVGETQEQGYVSWFWGGLINCVCCAKADDHQQKPEHWTHHRGNLKGGGSQELGKQRECCLKCCCPCSGREPDHQEKALRPPSAEDRSPPAWTEPVSNDLPFRPASVPLAGNSVNIFHPTPLPGLHQSAGSLNRGRLFDTLDRNHDGVITKDELEQALGSKSRLESP